MIYVQHMNLLINANGGCFFIASETLPPTCRETVSQENWSGAKASVQGVGWWWMLTVGVLFRRKVTETEGVKTSREEVMA